MEPSDVSAFPNRDLDLCAAIVSGDGALVAPRQACKWTGFRLAVSVYCVSALLLRLCSLSLAANWRSVLTKLLASSGNDSTLCVNQKSDLRRCAPRSARVFSCLAHAFSLVCLIVGWIAVSVIELEEAHFSNVSATATQIINVQWGAGFWLAGRQPKHPASPTGQDLG